MHRDWWRAIDFNMACPSEKNKQKKTSNTRFFLSFPLTKIYLLVKCSFFFYNWYVLEITYHILLCVFILYKILLPKRGIHKCWLIKGEKWMDQWMGLFLNSRGPNFWVLPVDLQTADRLGDAAEGWRTYSRDAF